MTQSAAAKTVPPDLQAQANALQQRATNPDAPVWVGASAGSGKTTVLANRLLRLMLPAENRKPADPSQILCITFTKAGASEVMERVVKILRRWTIAEDAALETDLAKLLETAPDPAQVKHARSLFARVIETPGGMKIMTIHAFCQSVLARFPMEAGLPAGFEVMVETEARELMRTVRRTLITRILGNNPGDKALKDAFDVLSAMRNAKQIESLMERMAAERARMRALLIRHGDINGLCAAVDKTLNVAANASANDLVQKFCEGIPDGELRVLLPRLQGCTTQTNKDTAASLDAILSAPDASAFYEDYKSVFLTQKGEPRKLVGICKDNAAIISLFNAESTRLQILDKSLRNIITAASTRALLRFSAAALEAYESEKRKRNRLDFEDLIDRTKRLLDGGGVNWVQYKLDGGIDHILVDEAQDTNPDQWDIITALYDEFYAGLGAREDKTRTTFVVGDEKQSIFSFQRADPRVFDHMHERLDNHAREAGLPLQTIPMKISFRSSPSILRMVDETFAPPAMREGVVQNPADHIEHFAFKSGKAGHVELWPCLKKQKAPDRTPWALPMIADSAENPVLAVAECMAQTIKRLLAEKLESEDRLITPGDIMILVARRKPMAEAILKALRKHNIPVSGIDRMVVTKQLAVQDALAAIAFVLQPDDDLNLAALLKSPFIGMDEDTLFKLSYGRKSRPLWQAVKEADGPVAAWLSNLLALEGAGVSPFLHRLLYTSCPTDKHSGLRAILSRLGEDVRDPLQELLARADRFDMSDARGLQGFLQDALEDDSEIKREMEESGNRVRLMTVHGAKGLEAPIVFLPDTIRNTASRTLKDPILWPDRDDVAGVPLWVASTDTAADAYKNRAESAKNRGDEEYRRLLYVALTRAAERLYIGGAQKSEKSPDAQSWYFACEAAMKKIGVEDNGTYTLSNRQTDPIKKAQARAAQKPAAKIPAWAFEAAPAIESPPRPLIPSKPEKDEPAALSPLLGDLSYRYRRGRIIHTLFQFLPELPEDERLLRAAEWLKSPAHHLTIPEQLEIIEATFGVLNDPAFAHLFSTGAKPEIPLTGLLPRDSGGHAIVSGQIDRLLVSESGITILDYKTNRPAPKTLNDVPEAYMRQMRTYRDLLRGIWPQKPVRCALLWTDGPALMDVTDAL